MITREQVADLQPGDVVRVGDKSLHGDVVTIQGAVRRGSNGALSIGGYTLVLSDGTPADWPVSLTVVSRAPRPLYVNHPRTEAKEHDVVRDGHGVIRHHGPISDSTDPTWWSWEVEPGFRWTWTSTPPQPLTLLVDGETGQVVQ